MENTKSGETSELSALVAKYSPFIKEVRKRIIFTVSVFAVSTITGFVFYQKIIKFLINILNLNGINLVFTSPFQYINLAISCGVAIGLVLVSPLLAYQILSFLKPALREREYKMVVGFLPISAVLFLIGFSFGALVMKWQIEVFLISSTSLGIGNVLDISKLLSTVVLTSALMGIGFQFPIILLLLLRIGIIKHNQLSKQRLWVYLGSVIFAILLPLDSILADVLLAMPLIVLFELTLILDSIFEGSRTKQASQSII